MYSFGRALEGCKSHNQVVYSSKSHVVWTTRYRRPVLVGPNCKTLRSRASTTEISALEITPDPVPRLCEVDPQFGIHLLVKHLKGISSHTLRKEFSSLRSKLPTLWTNRGFLSRAGGAPEWS